MILNYPPPTRSQHSICVSANVREALIQKMVTMQNRPLVARCPFPAPLPPQPPSLHPGGGVGNLSKEPPSLLVPDPSQGLPAGASKPPAM